MVGLRPIRFPLLLAFSIPDFTLARMMDNSSSANTALIWMKAWLIGSISPFRQSMVMLPRISSFKCLALMMLIISQSCWVERLRRDTSQHMMVSPGRATSSSISRFCFIFASPCSRSVMIFSAPAAFSSRIWRFRSCPFSSEREQRAYPYFVGGSSLLNQTLVIADSFRGSETARKLSNL